jgi:predicted dehydrogenase
MTVRFGLIGAGRMGATLARHLAYTVDDANLVAIADPIQQQLVEMRRLFENVGTHSDYNRLLDRSDLDSVAIATPTNTHVEVVKAAAAADKHIFTEKPLAPIHLHN